MSEEAEPEEPPLPSESEEDAPRSDDDEVPFESIDASRLLPGPDALTADEGTRLLGRRPGRVIVWAGDRDTGKTTLTCELYERLRRGETELRFAGSQTLLALEERSHPSRAISGRTVRETHRTERDPEGRELLHLEVRDRNQGPVNLLLADLPGETFRELRDSVTFPEDVPLIGRADKLVFLADGERLADPKRRPLVQSGIRQLLQRFRAAGLPDERTSIALVVTMWDLMVDDPDASSYWTPREAELLSELREIDAQASHFRVSARPPTGWGHDDHMETLTRWLTEPPPTSRDPRLHSSRRRPRVRQPKALRRS